MRYVKMALDLTQDQFEHFACDPWFRDALIEDVETGKVRLDEESAERNIEDYASLAVRLGYVLGRDDGGYYALPQAVADLLKRLETYAGRAAEGPVPLSVFTEQAEAAVA